MNYTNWSQTVDRYIREGRSVSGSKGDSTDKSVENSQAAFTSQLQNSFNQQFSNQNSVLQFLNGKFTSELNNPTGLDAATKASMTTNAINTAAQTYQNSLKGVQAQTATRGGPTALPSGVQSQIAGQLAGQEAGTESNSLNAIQQQDAQLKNQNFWGAASGLSGVASEYNPLSYATGANGAAGSVAGLSQAYTASNQNPLLGILGGVVGGVAGGAGSKLLNNTMPNLFG